MVASRATHICIEKILVVEVILFLPSEMDRVSFFSKKNLLDIIICYFLCDWVVMGFPMRHTP